MMSDTTYGPETPEGVTVVVDPDSTKANAVVTFADWMQDTIHIDFDDYAEAAAYAEEMAEGGTNVTLTLHGN